MRKKFAPKRKGTWFIESIDRSRGYGLEFGLEAVDWVEIVQG